jgi:hypothetical protein
LEGIEKDLKIARREKILRKVGKSTKCSNPHRCVNAADKVNISYLIQFIFSEPEKKWKRKDWIEEKEKLRGIELEDTTYVRVVVMAARTLVALM